MAEASHVVALTAIALCFSSLLPWQQPSGFQQGHLRPLPHQLLDHGQLPLGKFSYDGRWSDWNAPTGPNGVLKHAFEAKTDTNGVYQLTVDGDHEEAIYEVHIVVSSDPECSSQVPEAINKARISLTKNNGVSEYARYANALFYMPEKGLESCPKILLDMGILPPGTDDFYY